ncbi:MAG: restriction endonuclease, partial [Bacteroidota bacterium]|nr:restriction endonuclease [Bacteroidota bacterium]
MNVWSKKTVELAKTKNYLDRLYKIYPNDPIERQIDEERLALIEKSFKNRDSSKLVNQLLDLDKFPFKDSYVSFLRSDRSAIGRNPMTVKRICDILYKMGFAEVREGIIEAKEPNTRRGPQFRNWLKLQFSHVDLASFIESFQGIIFLEDSEKKILDFCNTKLGLGISKRPDFVAKSGKKYIVGEANFLSSLGGNQGRGFDDAVKVASKSAGNAYKVALVDGVVWIQPGSKEYKEI